MPKSSAPDSKYNLRSKPTDALKKKGDDDNFPEDVEKLSPEEYQKLLAKLFPSKYIKNNENEDEDENEEEEEEDEEDEEEEEEDSMKAVMTAVMKKIILKEKKSILF